MAADSKYLAELNTVQRWVKATVSINSYRLTDAPPQLPRPVIVWEAPSRGKDRNLTRWAYVNRVTQYGKLYIANIDHLADVQEKLITDLEERAGILPIYDAAGIVIALLKRCEITFNNAENLNVPFNLVYEVTYTRTKPPEAPHATFVGNRLQSARGYDVKNH
ncbi:MULTISPECIES: hypothetical protein [Pelosinus]|uniref:Uncharacterized protein n=1 Tax=Pelosinus fermentans B4 TaxID=1149862 RepID=I8RM99_9FIRM|nr:MULTISPECIES: hypothetical protein [Pelosinus]EIW19915.1 hypothetical protein FB4_0166 [Pelosinus fermentans B4]EIW21228.1 hypothetical protein FA11_0955 [Pelosinus fermentans A11]